MYANVGGLKSKLRDLKMILFDTEPDIAAFVETNLRAQEEIAVSGYTWVGKNRQHKEGGGGIFKHNWKFLHCWTRQQYNYRNIMDQAKIKKARKLAYRCFIWKTRV